VLKINLQCPDLIPLSTVESTAGQCHDICIFFFFT